MSRRNKTAFWGVIAFALATIFVVSHWPWLAVTGIPIIQRLRVLNLGCVRFLMKRSHLPPSALLTQE